MSRPTLVATAVAALLALAPAAARAQDVPESARPTVAIMPFDNGSFGKGAHDYDALGAGIADMLITELSGNPGIRVIERAEIEKILDEQKLQGTGRIDPATAVRVGRLLGARHMIFGGFVTDPKGNMRIDARAVDVETSRIEYVESAKDRADDWSELISRLAAKMNAGLKLPPLPERSARAPGDTAPAAAKPPFEVLLTYSRAIAAENARQPAEAVRLYNAVLERFPSYEPARKAVARLASAESARPSGE